MKDSETTFLEAQEKIWAFIEERGWQPKQTPKNLTGSVMIEAAELHETLQWANELEAQERIKDPQFVDKMRMEAADVLWYLLPVSRVCGFDLAQALNDKMAHNAEKYPPSIGLDHKEYHRIKTQYRQSKK